jgi:Fe-S-cluster containining protein
LPSGRDAQMTICGELNCSKCCHDREVVLTHQDVERLLTMGHYEQTFARPSKWGQNLKELIFMGGDCIFLKQERCSIYQNRPSACRVFPMTLGDNGPSMDPSCPHGEHFERNPAFITEANNGLKRIIEDVEKTIFNAQKRD